MNDTAAKRYLMTFLLTLLTSLPVFFAFQAFHRISGCDARPQTGDNYLAYCWKKAYVDYEHGAYWMPMEPDAIAAAKAADVLILGNSRTQYAFSNEETAQFEAESGLRVHVMAFAGEGDRFSEALIARHDLRPRLVLLNLDTDQFFDWETTTTKAARNVMERPLSAWVEYALKRTGQEIQRLTCRMSATPNRLCGTEDTLYRDRRSGQWRFLHRPVEFDNHIPVVDEVELPTWPSRREIIVSEATRFAQAMRARGICVVAINVPNSLITSSAVLRDQAHAMGAPLITPAVAGLGTFDQSHLAPPSARRYARAVYAELSNHLAGCATRPPHAY